MNDQSQINKESEKTPSEVTPKPLSEIQTTACNTQAQTSNVNGASKSETLVKEPLKETLPEPKEKVSEPEISTEAPSSDKVNYVQPVNTKATSPTPQENGDIGEYKVITSYNCCYAKFTLIFSTILDSVESSSPSSKTDVIQEPTSDGPIKSLVFENKNIIISPVDSIDSKSNKQLSRKENVDPSKSSQPLPAPKGGDVIERKGPISYASDFLRELATAPLSMRKPSLPSNLLDKGIIRDIARPPDPRQYSGRSSYADPSDLMQPTYYQSGNQGGNSYGRNLPPRMIGKISGRNSGPQGGPHMMVNAKPRKIIQTTSMHQDVQLHQTGNAWKPQKVEAEATSPDEQATIKLLKNTRGILNKLTPDNFKKLSEKIDFAAVDTEDKMSRMLDLIFEKAIDEPAFCVQYSQICLILSRHKIFKYNEEKKEDEEVKFFRLLLSKCQKEFESEVYDGIDLEARQEEIDNETDPTQKKIKNDAFDEEKRLARKRALGNIRLIGELYKLKMLKHSIMCGCVFRLISLSSANPEMTDENMECLCGLLKTIGDGLEADVAQYRRSDIPESDPKRKEAEGSYQILAMAFEYMKKLTGDKEVQPRVRFMIQDVLDLRETGWKPRRSEAPKPTTVAEIHKNAADEERRAQIERDEHARRNKGKTIHKILN